MDTRTQEPKAWHALDLPALRQTLDAGDGGLSEAEAAVRLEQYGPNKLPEQPPPSLWQIVLRQFYSPLIYILLIAAVVSVFIGDLKDAGFIAAVLAINAVIGAYQEWKAEQSSRALRRLLQIRASVLRDEEVREIPAEQTVPGDVVWLESGNRVAAAQPYAAVRGARCVSDPCGGNAPPVVAGRAGNGAGVSDDVAGRGRFGLHRDPGH